MDAKVTAPAIKKQFRQIPDEIFDYFEYFMDLVDLINQDKCSWDVVITYMFSRVEHAHVMTIYCGAVRQHGADKNLAWTAVAKQHNLRKDFPEFYESVFGTAFNKELMQKINHASDVRDKIIHDKSKSVKTSEKLQAVVDILEYAERFNQIVNDLAGFKPFGDLTGFHLHGVERKSEQASVPILKELGFTEIERPSKPHRYFQ